MSVETDTVETDVGGKTVGLLTEPSSSTGGKHNTESPDIPARSGVLPPRRAPKLNVYDTQKIQPATPNKLPPHRALKAANTKAVPSSLMVPGNNLLVLPLKPWDIFELTTLFNNL